jgi:branched-chain amino acid transport system permease protein
MRQLSIRLAATLGIIVVLMVLTHVLTENLQTVVFRIIMLSGIAIIMAVSLNFVNGFTGQFSIGHAGFQAVGAYAAAAIAIYGHNLPFLRDLPIGGGQPPDSIAAILHTAPAMLILLLTSGGISALIGYLVGLPSLRLRGDYLAIVTLGFGEIIRVILINVPALGGAQTFDSATVHGQLVNIPALTNFFWVYLVAIGVVVVARNIRFSSQGLSFLAVREDEIAAQAMGVNTTAVKVKAFVIGAFFAGVAGALYAMYDLSLNTASFTFVRSFEFVTMVVLGGLGSITGSVIAAVFLTALPEILRSTLSTAPGLDQYRLVTYALLLVILMLVRPQGIFGRNELRFPQFLRKKDATEPRSAPMSGGDGTTG